MAYKSSAQERNRERERETVDFPINRKMRHRNIVRRDRKMRDDIVQGSKLLEKLDSGNEMSAVRKENDVKAISNHQSIAIRHLMHCPVTRHHELIAGSHHDIILGLVVIFSSHHAIRIAWELIRLRYGHDSHRFLIRDILLHRLILWRMLGRVLVRHLGCSHVMSIDDLRSLLLCYHLRCMTMLHWTILDF